MKNISVKDLIAKLSKCNPESNVLYEVDTESQSFFVEDVYVDNNGCVVLTQGFLTDYASPLSKID